jgi:transcriptional regulator of aromatic amino acid metabolism
MMKYGMAEILESQARTFVKKEFTAFDESAKERYLKAILDYIYRNYPSSKDVA